MYVYFQTKRFPNWKRKTHGVHLLAAFHGKFEHCAEFVLGVFGFWMFAGN